MASQKDGFRKLAMATIIATYFLIFVGGLVRVAGAGLGCPDWPKCFDSWIPPTSIEQVPPEFSPEQFNFVLAWTEYINRLIGVVIGFLIFATAIAAFRKYRQHKTVLYSAFAALILVAFQGWLGGQVVATELAPILVSVHMIVALIIVSLLIYSLQQAYMLTSGKSELSAGYPAKSHLWFAGLWIFGLGQIVFGTQVREALEIALKNFPSFTVEQLLSHTAVIIDVHASLGALLTVGVIWAGWKILKLSDSPTRAVTNAVKSAAALAAIQILTGVVLKYLGLPGLSKLFHLLFATMMSGLLFFLYVTLKPQRKVR